MSSNINEFVSTQVCQYLEQYDKRCQMLLKILKDNNIDVNIKDCHNKNDIRFKQCTKYFINDRNDCENCGLCEKAFCETCTGKCIYDGRCTSCFYIDRTQILRCRVCGNNRISIVRAINCDNEDYYAAPLCPECNTFL